MELVKPHVARVVPSKLVRLTLNVPPFHVNELVAGLYEMVTAKLLNPPTFPVPMGLTNEAMLPV